MNFIFPELIARGGWLMYPIVLCSVIALGIFIERLVKLRASKVAPREFFQQIQKFIKDKKHSDALELCRNQESHLARICQAALRTKGQPRAVVKEAVQEVGRHEAEDLAKHISVLGTVASISPLLGLLGTVSGMIKTFNVISYYGVGNPGTLAAGISEALLTTAAGLSVAIPTLVAYRFLSGRADALVSTLEKESIIIVDSLTAEEC